MRQKLGFIMATLHSPDLLLLDEPTTGVDPASREELWTLIATEAAQGRTVIFSTTYIDEAERTSSICLLNEGRLIAHGDCESITAHIPGTLWSAPANRVKWLTDDSPFGSSYAERTHRAAFHNWRRADTAFVWTGDDDNRHPEGFEPCCVDMENASIVMLVDDDDRRRRNGGGRANGVNADAANATDVTDIAGIADVCETKDGRQVDAGLAAQDSGPSNSASWNSPICRSRTSPTSSYDTQTNVQSKLVEARTIVKKFGAFTALHGVSLHVDPGEIVGLIGGNGAGKTTLMRILLGLETSTDGDGLLMGRRPSLQTRRHIGYVPQGLGLYPTLNAVENMRFACRVYGIEPAAQSLEFARTLGGLPVQKLPLGAQRMLAYVVAAEHNPELFILDEPTSGMDPVSRMRLWRELHRKADQGAGFLVTTHYMAEAAQCDRCVILAQGSVVATGSVDSIIGGHESSVITTPQWELAFAALRDAGLPVSLDGRALRVPDTSESTIRQVLGRMHADSYVEPKITRDKATLEEILTLASR
jgi:ABC-2 type transport system ATP-binding protein